MPRKVTVDSSKSVRDSSSDSRRPSVFERLGPGGSSSHGSKQDHYGKWEGEGSRSYRDHYSHGEGSDSMDLRHRVQSKRAEKERDRDGSRDRSRGHRTPSPSGKRDRSKHRGSHKDHEGSERKKKSREPSSLVVKGGRRSPDSNHGDTDEWKSYDNPQTDDDPMSDEYGLEEQRRELQRQLDQIDHGQTGEDSSAEYSRQPSSRSPSPVRKKVQHSTKKTKKRDRSASKIRSRSPPHRSLTPEKKSKKKISPGKRETYPPLKKKKRASPAPARRGPRTPSPSPAPKKLKGKDMKKKKGAVVSKKGAKKRVSSSDSSTSSSGSDSSTSGSSGSSSSSDSEEEYVKKKKSPANLAKKKQAPASHHHHHHPMPVKAPRSRTPPPKPKPKPPSPKSSRRYSPSTPTRSDSSESLSPGRSLTPRLRQARKEATRRRSLTPEKRSQSAHSKHKQPSLYSRTPSPEPRKDKPPPPRRNPTPERDSYSSSRQHGAPPSKDSPYYSKRGRSPSMTRSNKSFSPGRRKRESQSPRRVEPPPLKNLPPPRSSSGDYRDRERDSRGDKYGGKPSGISQPSNRDSSSSRQQGRVGQSSYDYDHDRSHPRDSSSGRRGNDRPGWQQPGRGDDRGGRSEGRDAGRSNSNSRAGGGGGGDRGGIDRGVDRGGMDSRGADRGRGGGGGTGGRGGRGESGSGSRGDYHGGDRDPRYGGYPQQGGQQWDPKEPRGGRSDSKRGPERGERESRRDEWDRQRGGSSAAPPPPRGRYDQPPPPPSRGPMDRGMEPPYVKRPEDVRSRSPGKRHPLPSYPHDQPAKGSWHGAPGDGRYYQDFPPPPGPSPGVRDQRDERREYDDRAKWDRRGDDRRDTDRPNYPRDDRRDSVRGDDRKDYPRDDRRDQRDYPRDDRREIPVGDIRDYPKGDRRDYPRDDRRDFPKEERRDYPRDDRKDYPRDDRRPFPRDDRRDYPRDDRRDILREEDRRPREGSNDRRGPGEPYKYRDDPGYDHRRDGGRSDPRASDPRGPDPRGPDPRAPDPRKPDSRGYDSRLPDPRGPDPRGPDPRGLDPREAEPRYSDGRGGGRRDDQGPGRRGYDDNRDRGRPSDDRGSNRDRGEQDRYGRKRDRTDDTHQDIGGSKRMKEDERDPRARPEDGGDFKKRPGESYSDLSEGGSDDIHKGSPAFRERERLGRRGDLDQKSYPQRDSSRESSRDRRGHDLDKTKDLAEPTRERTRSKEPESAHRESGRGMSSRGNSMDRSDQTSSQATLRSRRSMSRGSTGSRSSSIVSAREKHDDNNPETLRVQEHRSRASSRESTTRTRSEPSSDAPRDPLLAQDDVDIKAEAEENTNRQQPIEPSVQEQLQAELPAAPVSQEAETENIGELPDENGANVASMQDDYEDISDEDFEDSASGDRSRRGRSGSQAETKPANVMDVDWAAMIKDLQEPLKAVVPAETSVLKRFSPGQVFARIGVSRALAGPQLMEEIEKVCKEEFKEDGEEAPVFKHQVGALNALARRRWLERRSLLQDIGPCRRALCARRDMAIRKQLRKVEKDPSEPVFSSAVDADTDLYRLSIQLLKNKQETETKPTAQVPVTS